MEDTQLPTDTTDDPTRRYLIQRTDDLDEGEKRWFEEHIKIPESVDETDDSSSGAAAHSPTIASTNDRPTNAFGKLRFNDLDTIYVLPSWFVRMNANTSEAEIQELLETKFEVMGNASFPIRIHCIDYDCWPSADIPRYKSESASVTSEEHIVTILHKDLNLMRNKTAGIVLTWSGLQESRIMQKVLEKIAEDRVQIHPYKLATIASPPWNALDCHVREPLKKRGETVHLINSSTHSPISPEGEGTSDSSSSIKPRAALGPETSHFFLLDYTLAGDSQADSSTKEKTILRHFHCKMIRAMKNAEEKKTVEMPVVCVLISGHHDALKMVDFALKKEIPVIIVKGSGGYADIIADVYLNAKLESTKYRDEHGQVRTRITKKAGQRGQFYMNKPETEHLLLEKIFNSLDLLTVYDPALTVQTLDSVVFEALLKNNQQSKFNELVNVMKKNKKEHGSSMTETDKSGFIDSDEVQMNLFIEALKGNHVDLVKMFLEELQISDKFTSHFHMGRILRLYSQNTSERERLIDFRKKFADLLNNLTVMPLSCVCEDCPSCDVQFDTKSKESELEKQKSCLQPIHELFLWSLHDQHVELAIAFWKRCEDRIASALVATKVFKSVAEKNPDAKWQMDQNVKQFQDLATQTLRNCHSMNEIETELLLTKPCPWWGNLSVLQLAIMTENREFMTQTACMKIMTRIWHGQPLSDPDTPVKRPCRLVVIPSDEGSGSGPALSCLRRKTWCSPFKKYIANFVMQLVFLLLFSCRLLFDIGHLANQTICCILIVWVAAITVEEVRQLVSRPSVLRDNRHRLKLNITGTKFKSYFSQHWNKIDVATVGLFWLGMVGFASDPVLRICGRILWSIDIFFFFMRTFQMLMVFEQLGLMLVMVYKMVKDTTIFMIILLTFVLAYTVTSESVLYPASSFTFWRLMHLPRKAYWQVFGEFALDEIEIREGSSCSTNQSKHFGYDEPHCPTKVGSYVVPILLGIHVMITNVLLLNLLIARFGMTFNKVLDEALEYQSWYRCQIITEFYNSIPLPPPFSLVYNIPYILAMCFREIRPCIYRLCCCCMRRRRQQNEAIPMEELPNAQDSNQTNPVESGEQRPFIDQGRRRPVDSVRTSISSDCGLAGLPDQTQGQQAIDEKFVELEKEQAEWVCQQQDANKSELKQFQEQLQEGLGRIANKVKEVNGENGQKMNCIERLVNLAEKETNKNATMVDDIGVQAKRMERKNTKIAQLQSENKTMMAEIQSLRHEQQQRHEQQEELQRSLRHEQQQHHEQQEELQRSLRHEQQQHHKQHEELQRILRHEQQQRHEQQEELQRSLRHEQQQHHEQQEELQRQQQEELQHSLQTLKEELVRSMQQELQAQIQQALEHTAKQALEHAAKARQTTATQAGGDGEGRSGN